MQALTAFFFPLEFAPKLTPKRLAKEKAALYAEVTGIQESPKIPKPKVRPRLSRRAAIQAFTPFEHAVLSDLFKIPRLQVCRNIDIWMAVDSEGEPLLNREVYEGLFQDLSLRNAAAQIILKPIEAQLPNYYSFNTKEFVRKPGVGATGKLISLKPQHLLTINWHDSGPGFSCPEGYYITYVPGYDRFVVTASRDDPSAFGCEDFVISWFSSRRDLRFSAGRVLCRFWRHLNDLWDRECWQESWDTGLISKDYANHLAYQVWGEYERRYSPPPAKPRDPYPPLFSQEPK